MRYNVDGTLKGVAYIGETIPTCLGDKRFRKELLARMSERMGPEHYGEERRESQEEMAQRVVPEELQRRHWREPTLGQRAKGDGEKVKIALRLRRATLMTVAWIAKRLEMDSVANVNTLLHHWRRGQKEK